MLNSCHEGVWVSGGNASFFNLQRRVEVVVSSIPWLLNLWYSLNRRM